MIQIKDQRTWYQLNLLWDNKKLFHKKQLPLYNLTSEWSDNTFHKIIKQLKSHLRIENLMINQIKK